MDEKNRYEELDSYEDDYTDTSMDELRDAAFEYLLLNPGSEFGDWREGLIEQYPAEVVDALGNNPEQVHADLADLWESDYWEQKTDIEQKFCDWAQAFATEKSVDLYYELVSLRNRLK